MPYTPNPEDPTQPVESVFAETAAAEFRALKLYIQNNLTSARTLRLPVGETFIDLPPKASLLNKFIAIDSGGNPVGVAAVAGSVMDVLLYLADASDPSKGAGAVGYTAGLSYAANSVGGALNQLAGLMPSGGDDTVAINAYLASTTRPIFGPGIFILSNKITIPGNNYTFTFHPNCEFRQTAAEMPIFEAINRDNLKFFCNYAKFKGRGLWSAAWTGSSGHFDRAFNLYGCTNLVIDRPHTYDCGLAGIAIFGGNHIRINFPWCEGTNLYTTPITSTGNFQFGLYLRNDPTYGAVNDCQVFGPNVSGVAIGVLYEQEVGAAEPSDGLQIIGANVHDITGQHAFYMTNGNFQVSAICTNIELAAFKVQAGDANLDISGWKADIVARNCGSQMFEIACPVPYTGIVKDFEIHGVGYNVARGASFARNIQRGTAWLVVENCSNVGMQIGGDNNRDLEIWINGKNIQNSGVLIGATSSTGLKIHPILRECNVVGNATDCGILVASASADMELFDVDITDNATKMKYGIFNSVLGSVIRMRGSLNISGANDTAIRATGAFYDFPTNYRLQGTNGKFSDTSLIFSSAPFIFRTTTTAAGSMVAWQRRVADNSAIHVRVTAAISTLIALDRGAFVLEGVFYRQGGGIVTLEGAIQTLFNQKTVGLGATVAIQSNGANDVVVLINQAGAVNTLWELRIEVVQNVQP